MSRTHSPSHAKRLRAERRFRFYGQMALAISVVLLIVLLGSLFARGYSGFLQTQLRLSIAFDPVTLGMPPTGNITEITPSSYNRLVQEALKAQFPEVTEPKDLRLLYALVSSGGGGLLQQIIEKHPELMGKTVEVWLPAGSKADMVKKKPALREQGLLKENQRAWLQAMEEKGVVRLAFNAHFLSQGDSRQPEQAGYLGAIMGSLYTLLICVLVVFPLGVMTAIYLEEFARPGRWVDLIEVNINNLAAVPSIVFGLLGLAVYINMLHMPRSAPLVGGLTLALMILPVIIITTRASLKAIPGSIRDAARALGASPVRIVWDHVLPLSMPGIMTGTILGLSRAIGETAPLLMIGMVAFVADIPSGIMSPATVMPVQIYLWASSPDTGFVEKTAAGILVLLVLLLAMNALAIVIRKRFEVRW